MDTLIPILVMNHGRFGEELITSAEMIIGKIDHLKVVSLMPGMSIEDFLKAAEQAIDGYQGKILVLTDLFGGTPCNVAMMLKQKYDLEILCGMNLPMVIELASLRESMADMGELVSAVLETAQAGVFQPSDMPVMEDGEEE